MKIRISLPPPPLYPNYRSLVPWPKVKALKLYREEAAVAALKGIAGGRKPMWKRASARVCFCHPSTRQFRDPDNMATALKAVWDGFQDAGLLASDRRLTLFPIEQDVDADIPRVEIEINEGAPPPRGETA